MMDGANWWLIALAFVLGLLCTFALMIRRVRREIPVSGADLGAAASGDARTTPPPSQQQTTKISVAEESETKREGHK